MSVRKKIKKVLRSKLREKPLPKAEGGKTPTGNWKITQVMPGKLALSIAVMRVWRGKKKKEKELRQEPGSFCVTHVYVFPSHVKANKFGKRSQSCITAGEKIKT